MATKKKLTDLQLLADIANSDLMHVVDVSDLAHGSAGTSKKVSLGTVKDFVLGDLTVDIDQINASGTPSATTFLRGDGQWVEVTSGGGGAVDSVNGQTGVVVLDTDDIDEGSTNLYYTTSRANVDFDSRLAGKSTSDLAEGTNLYYTDTRFDDRLATKSTDDVSEGTNLYFTTQRVLDTALTSLNVSGGTIVATDTILEAFGKIQNQINSVIGGVSYQGAWNATTNSPSLSSSVGVKGNYYVVSVPGATNLDGITDWKLGDWAIFNGSAWEKVDNTDAVISVNGFTGAVILSTADIAEDTNLYFTDSRAIDALTGENISIFTNDAGYVTSAGLSAYAKLDGTNQPFTGNVTVSKDNPQFVVTNTTGTPSSAYWEKLTTGDGAQLSSENRLYVLANGLNVVNDYFNGSYAVPNLTLSGAFTISFWFRPTADEQNNVCGNASSYLSLNASGLHQVRIAGGTNRRWIKVGFTAGTWRHYVLTRNADGSIFNLYNNGVASTLEQTGNNLGSDFALQYLFSAANAGASGGTYDEIIIKQSLSAQSDVDTLYNGGLPVEQDNTGMLRYYQLNSSSGNTIIDTSTNASNLSLLKNSGGASTTHTWVMGIVQSGLQPLTKIPLVHIVNNAVVQSYGTLTYGYYSGISGTSNIYDGLSHTWRALGTSKMTLTSSGVNISQYTGSFTAGSSITAGTTLTATTSVMAGTSITAGTAVYTGAGLVGTPAVAPSSDSNTGIFYPTADTWAITVGGLEAVRVSSGRLVSIGSATTSAHSARLDLCDGGMTLLLGASSSSISRTNLTDKISRVSAYHYTNAEEPMAVFITNSQVSTSTLSIGGGSGLMNAITNGNFYASANNTTLTGSVIFGYTFNGLTFQDAKDLSFATTTGTKIGTATDQKIGFWNKTPVIQQVTNAYVTDDESVAYTGIDNLQIGSVYAQLTDINFLRVAYENLRASYDDLLTKLKNTGIVA